jgi:co-chaperonin GroES (HSP10)
MNFKPTQDWVLLPHPNKKVTDAGIILSDSAAKAIQSNVLKVIAAGPECKEVKENDTVMVHPETAALPIELDKEKYLLIKEFSICGIFK